MNLVRLSDRHAYRDAKAICDSHGARILPFRKWVAERTEDRIIEERAEDMRSHDDDYAFYGECR